MAFDFATGEYIDDSKKKSISSSKPGGSFNIATGAFDSSNSTFSPEVKQAVDSISNDGTALNKIGQGYKKIGNTLGGLSESFVTGLGVGTVSLLDQILHVGTKFINSATSLPQVSTDVKNNIFTGSKSPESDAFRVKNQALAQKLENARLRLKENAAYGQQYQNELNPMSNTLAGKSFEAIGGMVPQVAAAYAGAPVAALALSESFMNVEQSYDENIKNGMNKKEAIMRAVPQLGADLLGTYLTDKLGAIGKISGEGSIIKLPNKFLSKTLELLKDAGIEVAQEVYQQGLQNLATKKTLTDGMSETALITIAPALLFGGAANISEMSNEEIKQKAAEKIAEINQKVAENKPLTDEEAIAYAATGGQDPFINAKPDMTPEAIQAIADQITQFQQGNLEVAPIEGEVAFKKKEEPKAELSTKILEDLQGREIVSKQYILDATNRGEIKQQERDIIRKALEDEGDKVNVADFTKKVRAELLPLKITRSNDEYEHVSLKEGRGNVKDYGENVYESPYATLASGGHYPKHENYFGHTRYEDMGDNTTRRIIEVQSDLAQKGGIESLESEDTRAVIKGSIRNKEDKLSSELYSLNRKIQKIREDIMSALRAKDESTAQKLSDEAKPFLEQKKSLTKELQDLKESVSEKGLNKLKQYSNPTAHFRLVREEIKKAAEDGKTKIQFPTGETAMKIEGLGSTSRFVFGDESQPELYNTLVTVSDLQVGQSVYDDNMEWIITDVLGDGKFRAIPKRDLEIVNDSELYQKANKWGYLHDDNGHITVDWNKVVKDDVFMDLLDKSSYAEQFDISGKIDKSNPIYRFYEKDLGRYLKNNYDAKLVTDKNGVTWYEVNVNPDLAEQPVMAFQKKTQNETLISKDEVTAQLQSFLQRLKLDVPFQFVDKIITPDNERAFGAFFDETITFEKFVTDKTVLHEIGHVVFRNLEKISMFDGITRAQLYREGFEKYAERLSKDMVEWEKELGHEVTTREKIQHKKYLTEEYIMEDLETFSREIDQKNKTLSGKIERFLSKVYDGLKSIFGKRDVIKDFYNKIIEGKAVTNTEITPNGIIDQYLTNDMLDFTQAAFKRKQDISQDEMEAEYALAFELPTQRTTEGRETKKAIDENIIGIEDKMKVIKSEQKIIKDRLKSEGKGFKTGEKVGIKIGRTIQQNIDQVKIDELKRNGELNKLKEVITRRSLINQSLDAIRKNIPPEERFKYMTQLARIGKKPSEKAYVSLMEDVYERKAELDTLKGDSRAKARARSTIAFLKKIYDLQPSLVADAKNTLGIEGAISKMNQDQLDRLLNEIKNRIDYIKRNNLLPRIPEKITREEREAIAQEAIKQRKNTLGNLSRKAKNIGKDATNIAGNTFNTVSKILKDADPALAERLRTSEFDAREYIKNEYIPKEKEFADMMEQLSKKSQEKALTVELSLFDSDVATAKEILNEEGIDSKPIDDMRTVLDDIYNRLKSVNIDVGYLENMFPRTIRNDAKKEINRKYADEIKRMNDEMRAKQGRDLTQEEKATIYTKYYRGFSDGNRIMLGAGRFDKSRTISQIDSAEIANYYERVIPSLQNYVSQAIQLYEAKKFFGKYNPNLNVEDADFKLSIGYLAEKLQAEGKITPEQNTKIQNALQAYFSVVPMNSVETFFINTAYVMGLGRITSAIPQLSETAMYIAINDLSRGELNSFRKFNITPEDINMELLYDNRELNIKKFAEAMTLHVKYSDKISAMIGLNGIFRAIKNDAGKMNADGTFGTTELRNKIGWIFGEDKVNSIIGKINETSYEKAGEELPYEIRRLMFSEIGRYRVLSRLDKTPVFIKHPIWGVFKTYTLKMLEATREEGNQEIRNGIKEGNKAKIANGVMKKATLVLALLMAGVGAQEAKDWIKGKNQKDLTDYAINTLLGMIGLSKYGFDTFEQNGLTGVTQDIAVPAPVAIPVSIFDSIYKDIAGHKGNAKTLNYVPIIGDILYNRL